MKNKALTHFKRKKFFYRFFMRKSPRTGTMSGLAWMTMVGGIPPFVLFMLLSCFGGFQHGWKIIAVAVTLLLLAAPFYIYGFLLCALGLSRIYRSVTKYKTVGFIAGAFGAWFLPLLGLILVPVLICKKKLTALLFAIAGTVFYLLSYLQFFNILSTVLWGTFCYLAALAFLTEKNRFSWKFMIPIGIVAASQLVLMGCHVKLQHDVKAYREQLSQIIGRSVETEEFRLRDARGFPIDREPLKSLIAHNPSGSYPYLEYKNAQTAQKNLLEYNKKFPEFVKAVNDFLQLPPSYAAHNIPEGKALYSVLMPELATFREVARYLAMNIAADPDNWQRVRKYNDDLVKLRNWPLQSDFFISYLVATALEAIRLRALAPVLSSGRFSQQEFSELAGVPVDWHKYMRYAFGAEAAFFKSVFDHLQVYALLGGDNKNLNAMQKYMPLFMQVHFLRDYRFALQCFIKACIVPATLSGLEKAKLAEVDSNITKRNWYMLSGMFLPSLGSVYTVTARIMNIRQMALLAAEVMEYRKQYGKLPEDLSFLPRVPLSKLDHKPLMYEKTKDGFRIFIYIDKGKKPGAEDTNHSYRVRLLKGK